MQKCTEIANYRLHYFVLEVGGKSKTGKQIKEVENGFVVKDEIEHGFGNVVPLWHFGMLY